MAQDFRDDLQAAALVLPFAVAVMRGGPRGLVPGAAAAVILLAVALLLRRAPRGGPPLGLPAPHPPRADHPMAARFLLPLQPR